MSDAIDGDMGHLPESWEVKRLSQIADLVSGGTPSKANLGWWQGTVPWVSPKDMKVPRLYDVTDHITEEAAAEGSRIVPAKTIFLVIRGMILANDIPIAITERPMAFNQDMKAIIPHAGIDPDFLFYSIRSQRMALNREISTSAHGTRRMGTQAVEDLSVPMPKVIDEQHAISKVLRSLEGAIEVQDKTISALRELKASTMTLVFSSGINGGESKATQYGEAPAHWTVKPLEHCATVQTGLAKGKDISKAKVERPYLRVANVQDGYLDLDEIKFITLAEDEVGKYLLRSGDVLMTEGGDFDKLGRGYIWRDQIPGCVHQNHIFAVRTNPDLLTPEFFSFLIQSPYGRSYFLTVAHKTTNLACINSTKLKEMPVLLPSLEEQKHIADILHGIDTKILAHQSKKLHLSDLFRAALSELLSGSLRTTPLLAG